MSKTYKDNKESDKFERVKNRSKKIKIKRGDINRKKRNRVEEE